MDNALSAYIDSLNDKYAKYYTAQEWEKFENENKGIFAGVVGSLISLRKYLSV